MFRVIVIVYTLVPPRPRKSVAGDTESVTAGAPLDPPFDVESPAAHARPDVASRVRKA